MVSNGIRVSLTTLVQDIPHNSAGEGGDGDFAGDEPEWLGGAKATLSPIKLESDDGNDTKEIPTHQSKSKAR